MTNRTFLVVLDDSKEFPRALRYAALRAKELNGRVAVLYIVEPQGIETFGGVEQAVIDEAFDEGRRKMAAHEKAVEAIIGEKLKSHYRKGESRATLLAFIEEKTDICALVLAAQAKEGGNNPLIQYFTSEKGLRKLKIPLIVLPETMRESPEIQL